MPRVFLSRLIVWTLQRPRRAHSRKRARLSRRLIPPWIGDGGNVTVNVQIENIPSPPQEERARVRRLVFFWRAQAQENAPQQ